MASKKLFKLSPIFVQKAMISSLAVFCGSSKGLNPTFSANTRKLGQFLASRKIEVIYGAGNIGLMGELAEAVLEEDGKIVGVIPDFLKQKEVCHTGLSELIVVETMHQRKAIMAERAAGFLVLPGGFGTLDEFFEILTWKQLALHNKPIGILNWEGYYDHLAQHIETMAAAGFLRKENIDLVIMESEIEPLLSRMTEGESKVVSKWI